MTREIYIPGGTIVVERWQDGHWVILEMRDATKEERDAYRAVFKEEK